MLSRLRRRPATVALSLFVLVSAGIFLMLATGLGPDRRLRLALGLTVPIDACVPDPEQVRNPAGSGGTWLDGVPLPRAVDEIRAVGAGGLVYLGTGVELEYAEDGLVSVGRMFVFDPASRRFAQLADAPSRIDHPLLTAAGGFLYLVGGYVDGIPTADTWRYSLRERRWSKLSPMPTARGALGGSVIGDQLFAVGGAPQMYSGAAPYRKLEILDLRSGRWRAGPPMRFARHHVGSAAVDGALYVVGGRGHTDYSLAYTERFDPRSGKWETLPELPQPAGGLAAAAVAGELVAVGGGDDPEQWVTGATWAFEPDRGRWRRLPDLIQARHGHGVAAVGGRLYVFGGAPCPGAGRTTKVELLDVG